MAVLSLQLSRYVNQVTALVHIADVEAGYHDSYARRSEGRSHQTAREKNGPSTRHPPLISSRGPMGCSTKYQFTVAKETRYFVERDEDFLLQVQ